MYLSTLITTFLVLLFFVEQEQELAQELHYYLYVMTDRPLHYPSMYMNPM